MKKQLLYLLMEIGVCLICLVAAFLLMLWPQDAAVLLSCALTHVLYPLLSFLLPLWTCKKGTSAFICAVFPFFLYLPGWIIIGLSLPALPTILTLVLSVLGANTGAEIFRRKKER